MADRGCIAFFSTYRPPLPFHIYSCPVPPTSKSDEIPMVDGETVSYNYNGRPIPSEALKTIIRYNGDKLDMDVTEDDVDSGRVSGLVFVSERTGGLETLHIALRFNDDDAQIEVFNFAKAFGAYDGVRMEDSGCIAGDCLIYVSTMDVVDKRRQPWTAVFRTNLATGETDRLTLPGIADLSPSVSPCGTKIAVASFQNKQDGWTGEIENLGTDIIVIDLEDPTSRTLVIQDGGWPTWGSDDVIFFHRKVGEKWGVFRANISNDDDYPTLDIVRVTPDNINAVTPAAIDAATVVVATMLEKSGISDVRQVDHYRHIEIFRIGEPETSVQITQVTNPLVDHFNPFVIVDCNGELRVGYHRCHDIKEEDDFQSQLHEIESPDPQIEVCRASGVSPSFSKDGKKLAFVNNEFTIVFVADEVHGKRRVYEANCPNGVFSPVWNQNESEDTLYVCVGASFVADAIVNIYAILGVSTVRSSYEVVQLTTGLFNNAFPSTNPDGTRLVFRSTRDWMDNEDKKHRHKNLYIMNDTKNGEPEGEITRLTNGPWTDTHCEWSPNGKWIVFASTCDKPDHAPELDNGLDPGYFAVYLVLPDDPDVKVRVIGSGHDLAGHVNHPFFSPDGNSIVVVSDLAGVSADPMSMPHFSHSVRPYGDIFIIEIDSSDIYNNQDVQDFQRITHSRFENSTASWAMVSSAELQELWKKFLFEYQGFAPFCPFVHQNGGHGIQMTGHLCIKDRRC